MWSHTYGDLWMLGEWTTCSKLSCKEQKNSCGGLRERHFLLFSFCVSLSMFEKIPFPFLQGCCWGWRSYRLCQVGAVKASWWNFTSRETCIYSILWQLRWDWRKKEQATEIVRYQIAADWLRRARLLKACSISIYPVKDAFHVQSLYKSEIYPKYWTSSAAVRSLEVPQKSAC